MSAPNDGAGGRPRTAAPPATGDSELSGRSWSSGGSDDDPGLFSFLPPNTANSDGTPISPTLTTPFPPNTAASAFPYSPEMYNRQTNPADEPKAIRSPVLSPAAAVALQYAQNEQANEGGTRRRGSWQHGNGNSPDEVVGNPYEVRLRGEDSRRISQGSSTSKLDAYSGRWDENGPIEEGYEISVDEHGIPLAPLEPTRSADVRMLTELGLIKGVNEAGQPIYVDDDPNDDSPYPEVRASVSNIDDQDMPVLTFRAWFLGVFFSIIVTALNVFFYFRYPSPFITPILVQVFAYPCGKLLAWLLPATTWRLPRWMQRAGFGQDFSLNPGPFNIKEHAALVIIANIATGPAFALNFSVAAEKFYGVDFGPGFDILLVLTTQTIGFGIAGLCRRFLVWPAAMIWPQNLVFCTLLNTLHAEDDTFEEGRRGLTRFRFLCYVLSGAFLWYFLPGFLFQALSVFSWVCWIAPNNVVVNQLFGVDTGLGMGLLTFDWSQIAYIGSPLVIPWWAQVNVFCCFVLAFWVISPAMYYSNVWSSSYLPISTSSVFDRFGQTYNTSAVVDTARMALDDEAYKAYSPLYLPMTYATTYGLAFMLSTSIIVHTTIYHGKDIMARVRALKADDDIHMRLMKAYPEVPDWWYMVFLLISVGMSIATVAAWDTQMPVWSLIVSLLIGFIYILPGGFIYAMTNTQITINLIIELIGGYIIPGRPFANMLFKVYAAQSVGVGLSFVQDLKLGHYMKIPPRTTFTVQITSTFIAALVQVGVKRWLVGTVKDICTRKQAALLICPSTRVFYSSSIIWGLIGPARQFGIGRPYNPILWWLLAGAVAPFISWGLTKRYPNTWVAYINVPVALTGAIFMPPATGINFSSWFLFGFIFQFYMRRRYYAVWAKYNFVLSAGLDAGTVCSAVVIFLCLSLPKGGTLFVNWWGNNVFTNTLDYQGASYIMPPEEGFGPTEW